MSKRNRLFVNTGLSLVAAIGLAGTAAAQEADAAAEAAAETTAEAAAPAAEEAVSTTLADALRASPQHRTLANGMETAALIERLAGPGPFTVFAPTDAAFSQAMQPGDIEALMAEAARPMLEKMMGYYIVPGTYDIVTLMERAEANGGSMTLATVAGTPLTLAIEGTGDQRAVKLTGDIGVAYVSDFDLEQANGMMHVINGVVVPSFDAPQSAAPAEATEEGAGAD